jgi:hypothetical protein
MACNLGTTMTQDDDKPDAPDDAKAFDRDAAIQQLHQTEAALRDVVRRKHKAAQARARAEAARDPREFAVNSLLAMEDALFAMFDSGETLAEVLAYLVRSMPDVAAADLRHALKVARARRLRAGFNAPSSAPAPAQVKATSAPPAPSKAAPKTGEASQVKPAVKRAAAPTSAASPSGATGASVAGLELPDWADGSDRMTEESEADYILRKHIEGPPEARRKFIGEHNS